jgi:hypothetical protein
MGKEKLELGRLVDFLFEVEDEATDLTMEGYRSSPEAITRFNAGVDEIVRKTRAAQSHSWVERARAKRNQFTVILEEKLRSLVPEASNTQDLLTAILSGRLGDGLKDRAQVCFRNRDISEFTREDLKSLLEDEQILQLMEDMAKKEKK